MRRNKSSRNYRSLYFLYCLSLKLPKYAWYTNQELYDPEAVAEPRWGRGGLGPLSHLNFNYILYMYAANFNSISSAGGFMLGLLSNRTCVRIPQARRYLFFLNIPLYISLLCLIPYILCYNIIVYLYLFSIISKFKLIHISKN